MSVIGLFSIIFSYVQLYIFYIQLYLFILSHIRCVFIYIYLKVSFLSLLGMILLFTALRQIVQVILDVQSYQYTVYFSTLPVVQVILQVSSAGLSAVENQVSVSAVEPSIQTLRYRHQLHVLHPPHLKPRLPTCTFKLWVEHHDSPVGGGATEKHQGRVLKTVCTILLQFLG